MTYLMQKEEGPHSDRWRVLALSCVVLCGQCFCYDIPAVVHDHLASFSGVSSADFPWFFNSLYSAYSLPNLVLPLFFGYSVDKRSSSLIVCVLAAITCAGQACVTAGITQKMPFLAILGRFIFGVGCESMGVVQNAILTHYFGGKEIAFALALNVSSARLGTILNDWISPFISSTGEISSAFSFGLFCSVVSLFCALELARSIRTDSSSQPAEPQNTESFIGITQSLSGLFWLAAAICVGGYCCIVPFISVFTAVRPVDLNQSQAGQVVSIAFIICAFATPVFGKFVDRFGRGTWILTASCFLLCLTHVLFNNYSHIAVMTTLGFAYSAFVASVWPLVPLTVPITHVGLAYGIMTSLQNAGLTIMPLLIASVHTITGTYAYTRWLFLGVSLLTLLLSTWLATEFRLLTIEDAEFATDSEKETLKSSSSRLFSKGARYLVGASNKIE